ncbi:hypothetical protein QR674_05070 [Acinetobacter chinensis]|uniref:Uncharacterized protein n=1 Tax=Acinetobacter chinensis TaxID=2004650 RepID=A0ABU3WD65_9GAMM|nr:hypothetical protein [Acinetobacter chinensis]MDV2468349.1 hypothetical protein [Acinetobacter chinensis]
MLTDQEIQQVINTISKNPNSLHEHPDCVRIAYTWLDAQNKIKTSCSQSYPIKHYIEKWAGRYVSKSDVVVAAYLHPEIKGKYPNFNISSNLTEPSRSRLIGISEAMTQLDYHTRHDPKIYKNHE